MKKTILFSGVEELKWYFEDIMDNKYNVVHVKTYKELEKQVQNIKVFLYIYEDSAMMNKSKVCSIIRKNAPHVFNLYGSIVPSELYIDHRLSIGFDDYIIFRLPLERVMRKINVIDKKHDLIIRSYIDSLTKCYNRNYFDRISNYGHEGVAMIDVDNFKHINDVYGHMEGDRVLSEIGRLIRLKFKNDDVIRYGGDEFLIVFDDNNKRIYNKLNGLKKKVRLMLSNNVSLSIGLSTQGKSLVELVKQADLNVYKAKRTGKDKVIY